jgi:hypothetical protein
MKWLRDIRTKLRPEEVIAVIFLAAFTVWAAPRLSRWWYGAAPPSAIR